MALARIGHDPLLTIPEVAARIGWPTDKCYRYVQAGIIPSVSKGRRRYVHEAELLACQEGGRQITPEMDGASDLAAILTGIFQHIRDGGIKITAKIELE